MEAIDIDFFEDTADAIREGKTLLVLGEGITYNYQNSENENNAFQELLTEFGEELALHQKDGLMLRQSRKVKKSKLARRMKRFYEQDFTNPLLEKLAALPFHLVISITPDITLKNIFEVKHYDYQHNFYKLNTKDEIIDQPTKEKPLLYNLFGCVEGQRDSIFIEHEDLFAYLQSIYNPNSPPPEALMSFMNEDKTDNIIFLGCDLDKWYFQLILHLLNIREIESNLHLSENDFESEWKNVYESGFHLNFVKENLENFVNQLYAQFEAGELRQVDESKGVSITEVQAQLNEWLDEGSYDQIFTEITSNEKLSYDKALLSRIQKEMTFKITFDLLNQLKIFITTLQHQ